MGQHHLALPGLWPDALARQLPHQQGTSFIEAEY
jgi:hypothetical protein